MPGMLEKPRHRRNHFRVTMVNRGSTWPDDTRPFRFDRRLPESCRRRPCGGRRLPRGFWCMDCACDVHASCMPPRTSPPTAFRARSATCPAPSTKVNATFGPTRIARRTVPHRGRVVPPRCWRALQPGPARAIARRAAEGGQHDRRQDRADRRARALEPAAARADRRALPARGSRPRARDRRRARRGLRRSGRRPHLQELLRQGEPDLARGAARPRHGRRARDPRRGPRPRRLPGPDRRAPPRRLRSGGRGRRRPADPGLPVAPDRPPARRRRHRRRDQHQEGPVPRAVGHAERRRQGRLDRQRAHPALRARRHLRLQHPRRRHARPADHGPHRLSRS